TLQAQVSAAYGDPIQTVAFYDGSVYVGQVKQPPYQLDLNQPAPGRHSLWAFATNTSGRTLVALPVSLVVEPPSIATPLLHAGATWRYLDTGVDPGPNWITPEFDDRGWPSGAARLGYGGDGEVTTISFG